MKLAIFSLFVLMFSSATVFSQIKEQIAAIRAEVTAVNKTSHRYNKKVRSIDGVSTEGAEAIYYLSGKGLKKVVVKVYGETFRATDEFYYSGEELIFAYQKVSRYNGSIGSTSSPTIKRIEETRLYRSGGKTIRIIFGKKVLKSGEIEFTEKEYELIEFSDQLKATLAR